MPLLNGVDSFAMLWRCGGVNAEHSASAGEVGKGVGGDVVDDAGVAHDPGAGGGLAGPVPKHGYGIGWVELDQVDVLDAVTHRQLGTSVGGPDVRCPVGSGEAFEEVAVVVDGDDGNRGTSGASRRSAPHRQYMQRGHPSEPANEQERCIEGFEPA